MKGFGETSHYLGLTVASELANVAKSPLENGLYVSPILFFYFILFYYFILLPVLPGTVRSVVFFIFFFIGDEVYHRHCYYYYPDYHFIIISPVFISYVKILRFLLLRHSHYISVGQRIYRLSLRCRVARLRLFKYFMPISRAAAFFSFLCHAT